MAPGSRQEHDAYWAARITLEADLELLHGVLSNIAAEQRDDPGAQLFIRNRAGMAVPVAVYVAGLREQVREDHRMLNQIHLRRALRRGHPQ